MRLAKHDDRVGACAADAIAAGASAEWAKQLNDKERLFVEG